MKRHVRSGGRLPVGARISPDEQEELYEKAVKIGDDPKLRELHRENAEGMVTRLDDARRSRRGPDRETKYG